MEKNELEAIIENIKSKLPIDSKIPVIKNSGTNLRNYVKEYIKSYGEILLILNSLQLADNLF